jgi:hypothetical protein
MKQITTTVLLSGMFVALAAGISVADEIAKSGTTSYVTHFVFHPMSSIDVSGVGKAVALDQGSLTLYTTSHCRPAPDRLTSHCATVHSQHFQLH